MNIDDKIENEDAKTAVLILYCSRYPARYAIQ